MQNNRMVKNFSLDEMNITDKAQIDPDITEFALEMQELRDWLRKPMKINSWRRTIEQNKACAGSPRSAHLDARAVDVKIVATDAMIWKWKQITEKHGKVGGVNRYNTFTHFTDHEDKFGNDVFVIRDKR